MLRSAASTCSAVLGNHLLPTHMYVSMRVSSYQIIEIKLAKFQFKWANSCPLPIEDELVEEELSHWKPNSLKCHLDWQ